MHGWPYSGWWELLKDFVIPFLAILIPTGIALWLARQERLAAAVQREEERQQDALLAAEARREAGFQAALAASNDLVRASFMNDRVQSAQAAINANSHLPRIAVALAGDHEPVWAWVQEELGIIGRAVDDKGDDHLPVYGDEIVLRSAHFADAMTNWVLGERQDSWFAGASSPAIENTPSLDDDEI
jgi:hypothetical protein